MKPPFSSHEENIEIIINANQKYCNTYLMNDLYQYMYIFIRTESNWFRILIRIQLKRNELKIGTKNVPMNPKTRASPVLKMKTCKVVK